MAGKLPGSAIQSNTISITQIQTTAITSIVEQAGPRVASLIYPGNDTAGNTVGGQTVYINGSGFETNNAIYINGNAVPSKSFISASNLSFTTPALSAGIYPVYVINTDSGATAIFVPGYISSAEPTWVTGAGSLSSSQDELSSWSYNLSATGDTPITYALAAGSSLPGGVSLAANGLISGTISSPSGNATTYTFSVVATDAQNQDSTRQFTVTTSTGEGVLFANNVLLIHADGTNNGNNHSFLDSSNNNFTITRNGNATQGSFSPFSQTGWSAYFDGSGDYLSIADNASLDMGSSNFTIEGWYFPIGNASSSTAILAKRANSGTVGGVLLYYGGNGLTPSLLVDVGGSWAINQSSSVSFVANQWNHFAIVRNGSAFNLYINGVSGVSATNAGTIPDNSAAFTIGAMGADGSGAISSCFISNFRVIKGTALYTSAFTPPTSPLTAVANTSLLTCQSNRFIDNSTNAFTITRNGDTSIQAFSPFAPTAAYSSANVGGSVYLDGSGDYLTASNPSMSGTWTVEFWWYPITVASQQTLISFNNGGLTGINMWCNPSAQLVVDDGSNAQSAFTSKLFTANSWNHVAIVKNGSTTTGYINGVTAGSNSFTPNTVSAISIGRYNGSPYYYASGYLSGVRVVQSAVYTTAFTPPTAPVTNIANTSLLCNFTNAQIFDQTAKNVLETVGDAKVSTAQYKYGTASMYFDGTGDYLVTQSSPFNALGSGDFTIEMWLYPSNTNSAYRAIIASDAYAATTNGWTVYQNGTSIEMYYFNGSTTPNIFTATSALTSSVWQHFALVRSSGTLKAYINGTQVASVSNSINFVGNRIFIGDNNYSGTDYFFNGYIDDLRITKGYARYTSNFTAPTAAFRDR